MIGVLTWKQLSAMLVKPETEGYRSCTEQARIHSSAASAAMLCHWLQGREASNIP